MFSEVFFSTYYAPGINTKCHICPAHYFFHEIAESGKAWQQKNVFRGYQLDLISLIRYQPVSGGKFSKLVGKGGES
jgi:GT2 family glycosyltransferase